MSESGDKGDAEKATDVLRRDAKDEGTKEVLPSNVKEDEKKAKKQEDVKEESVVEREKQVAVVEKAPIAAAEHPLQSSFCFYFIHRTGSVRSQESYESSVRAVGSFSTVEGFWGIYNHLTRPGDMSCPSDYHLFRGSIKPIWEHDANRRGGKWLIRLRKGLASRYWEELVLCLVGEQFEAGDEVCGIVVSVRYQEDILAVWNRSASNHAAAASIRETVRKLLSLPPNCAMEYKAHDASIRDNSSFRNTDVFRSGRVGAARAPRADWT